jgi:uncharacterized protein (DUF2147 family)
MLLARLAAATALAAALATPALAADPVEGLWLVQAGTAKMCGQITWLKNAGAKDANNPDASLRNRPVMGMLMIRDFKSAGPGKWKDGKIYDPNSGKTYGSKMSANPDGTLKVEGCVAVVCQAQTWKRTS